MRNKARVQRVKNERKFCFALHEISRCRALDISRAHAPLYVGHTAIFVCELSSIYCTFYHIPCCTHHLPQLCRISSNLFDSRNQRPTTVTGNTIRNREPCVCRRIPLAHGRSHLTRPSPDGSTRPRPALRPRRWLVMLGDRPHLSCSKAATHAAGPTSVLPTLAATSAASAPQNRRPPPPLAPAGSPAAQNLQCARAPVGRQPCRRRHLVECQFLSAPGRHSSPQCRGLRECQVLL